MMELLRKLSKDFLVIDPEISIHKAFELLSDPKINTLVYWVDDGQDFFFLTGYIINNSIKNKTGNKEVKCKEIAQKSIVFDYEEYQNNSQTYLKKFKNSLIKLNEQSSNMILVISKNKPIGLVSDLVFSSILVEEGQSKFSALEYFVKDDPEPIKNIELFYNFISRLGFELNGDLKKYIKELLHTRMNEIVKKEVLPQLDELIAETEEKSKDKNRTDQINLPEKQPGTEESITTENSVLESGIAVIYNPNHVNHKPAVSSPETPERLTKIISLIRDREKIFDQKCRMVSDYRIASEEDILRVHTKHYLEFVKNYASKGGGFLGDSTYITKHTHDLALLAAGGAIKAAEEVLSGNACFSLGLIRPPGHHASRDKYGGYCIYNNAAVLARYLQVNKGLKKILILDWDAHAANGTMDIFYDDPTVMLISLHQDPHDYYPKTGFISQMGTQKGLGYTINVEMPRGSGDNEYFEVFRELVIPLYKKHQPDFVIGCNGFDAHHSDPYTELNLTANGYYGFCKLFREFMYNKMVILMEGGYNPYMGELTHTLINGLLARQIPFEDKFHSLTSKIVSGEKIHMVLTKKINELKNNLKRLNIL